MCVSRLYRGYRRSKESARLACSCAEAGALRVWLWRTRSRITCTVVQWIIRERGRENMPSEGITSSDLLRQVIVELYAQWCTDNSRESKHAVWGHNIGDDLSRSGCRFRLRGQHIERIYWVKSKVMVSRVRTWLQNRCMLSWRYKHIQKVSCIKLNS